MTADIAIAAIAVVALAHLAADYRVRIRLAALLADRVRVVPPPKEPQRADEAQSAPVQEINRRAS